MKKLNFFLILLMISAVFLTTSCGSNEGKTDQTENNDQTTAVEANEFDILVKYLEENGNYINDKEVPSLITAEEVNEVMPTGYAALIDLRSAKDFADGHIEGAENVKLDALLAYFKGMDPEGYDQIILVCYSGQTASYAASALRLLGYKNVFSMKWGMSSWNKKFADTKWLARVSDKYAEQLEDTENEKNPAGNYPTISTGKKTGKEILEARVQKIFQEGFGSSVLVKIDDLMTSLDDYYIVNYWPENAYKLGHIPGAIQYTPRQSMATSTSLNTLPVDQGIVNYSFTGQNAAFLTAYMRILGYDAKSLAYGANSFMHNKMMENEELGHAFSVKLVKDFPFVTSEYKAEGAVVEEEGGC